MLTNVPGDARILTHEPFGPVVPDSPFGGIQDSRIGSEGGTETFDGYQMTNFVIQMD